MVCVVCRTVCNGGISTSGSSSMTRLECSPGACSSGVAMCNHSVSHRLQPLMSPIRSIRGQSTSTWQKKGQKCRSGWLLVHYSALSTLVGESHAQIQSVLPLTKKNQATGQGRPHCKIWPCKSWFCAVCSQHRGEWPDTDKLRKYMHISVCFSAIRVATTVEFVGVECEDRDRQAGTCTDICAYLESSYSYLCRAIHKASILSKSDDKK